MGYSLGVLSVGLKDKDLRPVWKVLLTLLVVMISLSVCFVKQHSALDVLLALPLGLLAEAVVFRDWWRDRFRGKKEKV